jgi:hypothetical protein
MPDGVSLIFVWHLLSYQYIYVIAHIICNHPVGCKDVDWVYLAQDYGRHVLGCREYIKI